MAYAFKPYEKAVGSFVIIGIATLLLAGVFLAKKAGVLFTSRTSYFCYFNKADSLSSKMTVYYNGYEIGKCTSAELQDDDRVLVKFVVDKSYTNRVRMDSVANLMKGIVGGASIVITKGRETSPFLPPNSRMFSSDEPDGVRLVKEIHGRAALPPAYLDQIVAVLLDLLTADGPVMRLVAAVTDLMHMNFPSNSSVGQIMVAVKEIMQNVSVLMGQVKNNDGSVAALLSDQKVLYNRMMNIMRSADETLNHSSVLMRNLATMPLLNGTKERDTKGVTIGKQDKVDAYSNR